MPENLLDYRAIFEALPGSFVILSPNSPFYTILAISDQLLTLTGREREAVIGKSVFEAYPENPDALTASGPSSLRLSLHNAIDKKTVDQMPPVRYDILNAAGVFEARYWSSSSKPVLNPQGEVLYLIHATQDITDQIQAEKARSALGKLEKNYELLLKAPVAVSIVTGPENVVELANQEMLRLWDKTAEVIGKPLLEAMPHLRTQGFPEVLDQVRKTGEPFYATEYPAALPLGGKARVRYYNFFYQPYYQHPADKAATGVFSVVHEVTEQVLARKKVEASEARFRSLAENAPDVITRHGKDYRYLYASPRIEGLTGIKAEAFVGKSYRELGLPEELCRFFDQHLAYVFAHQSLHTVEYAMHEGKGYLLSRMVPEYSEQGEVESVLVLSTDISERNRTEAALRESEARFRLMADAVPQIVWLTDPEGRVEFFNKQWTLYTGAAYQATTAAQVAASFVHPEDGAPTMEAFQKARQAGSTFLVEHRIRSVTGEYRWFLVRAEPYRDAQTGELIRWFGASVDIHDRKLAEEALGQAHRRITDILESTTDAFYALDGAFNFTYVNQRAAQLWGRERDSLLGKHYWREFPKAVGSESYQKHYQALRADEPVHYETISPLLGCWIDVNIYPGKDGSLSVFFRDISGRKQAEQQQQALSQALAAANEDLRAANADLALANERLRHINADLDNFVYTASHDLKAPILNIEGLLKALERQLGGEQLKQDSVQQIYGLLYASVNRFKKTILDLTEVARIGKESLEDVDRIDPAEVLAEVLADLEPQIREAGARLERNLDCPPIHFSKKNLKSILYNLLSNAIKYRSPERNLQISITCQVQQDYQVLTVADNGLGMDMRQEEKIFALFKRLHNHVEGTGIGLYIVKKMVGNAGGRIEVKSQVGVGSTFRVYFRR